MLHRGDHLRRLYIIIPTQGRSTLWRALESCRPLAAAGAAVLVVVDTFEMPYEVSEALVERIDRFGFFHPVLHNAQQHDYGHSQINHGMTLVPPGNYILGLGDDDVLVRHAKDYLDRAIKNDEDTGAQRPHIWRFRAPDGRTLPVANGPVFPGGISGQCLMAFQLHGRVGTYDSTPLGDFVWIQRTLGLWQDQGGVEWHPETICVARPERDDPDYPQLHLDPERVLTDTQISILGTLYQESWRTPFGLPYLGHEHQLQWWEGPGAKVAFIYRALEGRAVGYGLLRQDVITKEWWSSVGVRPAFRGMGAGKQITRHLIRQCPDGKVVASANKDNPGGQGLHVPEDWLVTGEDETRIYYATRPEIQESAS